MVMPSIPAFYPIASPDADDEPNHDRFAESPRLKSGWGLVEWFAVAQVAGPALLYLPGTQRFRVPLRMGVFALSLFGLAWWMTRARGAVKTHPSWSMLVAAALYMTIMLVHPATNTLMAGMAQIGMHLAVAAPLFWAPVYFRADHRRLARVLAILWVLNGASVLVGIMQVRDPGRWMPAEFTSNMDRRFGLSIYQYRAADGRMATRPAGLGDSPGAACAAGVFTALIALAYLGLPVSQTRRLLGLGMGAAGVLVIFLSHVRSSLVVVVFSAVAYSVILVGQRRFWTTFVLWSGMAVAGSFALLFAESIGGKSTIDRFATLLGDDASKVYEKSARMGMLTDTFDRLLVEYPLGAGLGRWGMMRTYFGDESNTNSPLIWAEIQFASWALDGGVMLVVLYLSALTVAMWRLVRSTLLHPSMLVRQWGAVIVMLSLGPIALLFSYPVFNSQIGMQFWLLIGAFEGMTQGEDEQAQGQVPENWLITPRAQPR